MSHAIISRAEWGARYPGGDADAPLPAREVWLHHSVTAAPPVAASFEQDAAAVRQLEQIGQGRFRAGISYTFAITPAGRIFEGHGIRRRGTHTGGRNSFSRAIVLIGNYETAEPTAAQLAAAAWLLAYGADPLVGWWDRPRLAGGHRDAPGASTACPGRNAHAAIPVINGLAGGTRPSAPTSPAHLLPDQEVDDLMASIPITPDQVGRFHEAIGAEAGGGSRVAATAWVTFGSTYGGTAWTVAALGEDGRVLAYWPDVRTTNNRSTSRELPAGTRCVTVEGQADNAGTRPWASYWGLR